MESRFLRIAYAIQFVVTLMSVFAVWGQVGGQFHLDLMPWYWKFLLAFSLSFATVKATAAAVNRDRLWNRWTTIWLAIALALIVIMGLRTYYEHLHEPADEGDEQPAQSISARADRTEPPCVSMRTRLFTDLRSTNFRVFSDTYVKLKIY